MSLFTRKFYCIIRYKDKCRCNYWTKRVKKGEHTYLFKLKLFHQSGYYFSGSNFDWFIWFANLMDIGNDVITKERMSCFTLKYSFALKLYCYNFFSSSTCKLSRPSIFEWINYFHKVCFNEIFTSNLLRKNGKLFYFNTENIFTAFYIYLQTDHCLLIAVEWYNLVVKTTAFYYKMRR